MDESAFEAHIERISPESLTVRRITTPEAASLRFSLMIELDCMTEGANLIPFPRVG